MIRAKLTDNGRYYNTEDIRGVMCDSGHKPFSRIDFVKGLIVCNNTLMLWTFKAGRRKVYDKAHLPMQTWLRKAYIC